LGAGKEFFMNAAPTELIPLLASVSAQLRSALSNFRLASTQLIPAEAREQDPDLDARAALLDQSYYRLLRLANNLSMMSSLANEPELPLRDTDVVDLAGELYARAASLAPMLGLKTRFVCGLDRQICAVAPEALEQIINHLLSNAFKFTPAGGTVTVELRKANGRLLFSVEDTGCGISRERIETLFERYLHPELLDPPPYGLGMGLPLCRSLAAAQHGTLMVESKEGRGSRFTLSLPDRQLGTEVADLRFDYSGGFNRTLLGLADALPAQAFSLRDQD
jgi:signal transduction histidine kinase